MSGLGATLFRLPAAAAFFAGVALLASTAGTPAYAKFDGGVTPPNDDTALAIPRVGQAGSAEVSLPQPLAPSDTARIRRIFALQAQGAISAAEHETARLDTDTPLSQVMLGYILADRYLGRFTKPGQDELRAWLARWPDLPDASNIHNLLMSRLPASQRRLELAPPPAVSLPEQTPVPEETGDAERALVRNSDLDRSVAEAARRRGVAGVHRLLSHTSGLAPAYRSQLAGEAAQILFTLGRDEDAYEVGASGVHVCGQATSQAHCQTAALAGFSGGLAAWRMGRPELARPLFEAAWDAELTTPSLRAGSALWAARAHLRTGDFADHGVWLGRAAAQRDTFYGMLARRMLGLAAPRRDRSDSRETLGLADTEALSALPAGQQAFALLQVGEQARAEAALRRLWPDMQAQPALTRAVMLVADKAEMSELAAQLADALQVADGRPRETTRFRIPRLRPDGGFQVDPAIVLAVARTESNFGTDEFSAAGALGMMQIMPDTASFITAGSGNSQRRAPSEARIREMLADPPTNLALGQRYIAYLATHEVVNGNLMRLLASYNCGPGKFGQWVQGLHDSGDPLLFIEAIPIDETRAFVPRVLTYAWIYAGRLHMPAPSLDELAVGAWPRYHPLAKRIEASAVLH